jgi:proteasome lid subunit RPN8/RPN11
MVAFQEQNDLIDSITSWLNSLDTEEEPCGVVHLKKGKIRFVPVTNVSDEPKDYFQLDSKEYTRLNLTGEILYIVHAHMDNCVPSEYDIKCCNAVKIPYVIFNRINLDYFIISPEGYKTLSAREYEFGITDCFEACRDWYIAHGIMIPPRLSDWQDDWWEDGTDYLANLDKVWPFVEASGLRYGDLITFAIGSDIENHIGVYIDQDCFFHHAVDRLSCKENLYPFWGQHIKKVYRYEGSDIQRVYWG